MFGALTGDARERRLQKNMFLSFPYFADNDYRCFLDLWFTSPAYTVIEKNIACRYKKHIGAHVKKQRPEFRPH